MNDNILDFKGWNNEIRYLASTDPSNSSMYEDWQNLDDRLMPNFGSWEDYMEDRHKHYSFFNVWIDFTNFMIDGGTDDVDPVTFCETAPSSLPV